ncbi:MAG: Alpha-ribazole phosphatase [Bacteroidota bacterium]
MNKKDIYIIRHGETDFNKDNKIQGQGIDSILNAKGLAQGDAFFQKYQDIDFQLVITSRLQRTQQTIQDFLVKKIPHLVDDAVIEISWGEHEGKGPNPEMSAHFEAMKADWNGGNFEARAPKGESLQELINRLQLFLAALKTRPEERILVCTHGRTLRALMCLVKGVHPRFMDNFPMGNTVLYQLQLIDNEEYVIIKEGDSSHLKT